MQQEYTPIINDIKKIVNENQNFVIISHSNPDGDAIGSSMAWYNSLILMNKKVNVVLPNDCPEFLKWLNGSEKTLTFLKQPQDSIKVIKEADVLIFVDFNSPERIDELKHQIKKSNALKILIDHHPNPSDFANIVLSDTKVSSTAELVFNVLYEFDNGTYINEHCAEAIYIGIITDTGSLTFNSSRPETYNVVSHLIAKNIDKTRIHELTFNVHSADRMMLLGKVLSQNMVILKEYNAAYMYITKKDQEKYNFAPGDSEGFVNYPLSIKGIKLTALFTENEELTKVSLRSKGSIPANKISETYFNGGGHLNAAGGRINKSLEETIKLYLDGLENFKDYLI